ncbi:MAG: hypothetical protein ABL886_11300 [Rhodoglobus sp.]
MVKRTTALVIVTLGVLFLSACDSPNMNQGPVAIARSSNGFEIAVCSDIDAASIQVFFREDAGTGRWETVWDAEGLVEISTGEILTATSVAERFDTVSLLRTPALGPASGIEVLILSAASSTKNVTATFDLRDSTDDSSKWIHPDGSSSDEPCRN